MRIVSNILKVLVIQVYINMIIGVENKTITTTAESSVKLTVNFQDTEQARTTSPAVNKSVYVTEQHVDELTELVGLLNVTTSEFDNSTDENDNEIDEIHSSFNLAIIPAAAIFVFMIIICIKCCKWFRQYTRGGSKDEMFYAVIVTDDDKDYGQIDITSDSTSTACYDTVSSYASFLKRSGNESTLSSIRAWRQESTKSSNCASSPSKSLKKEDGHDDEFKPITSNQNTRTKTDETNGSFDVRISSTSSSDTVSEQLTDSPAIKRNNRFRVSFVTDSRSSTSEIRTPNGNIQHEKHMRSSLKKSSTATSPEKTLPNGAPGRTTRESKMVDVGTQTNKSFRYSLRKSKGHVSESDTDKRLISRQRLHSEDIQTDKSQLNETTCSEKVRENSDKSDMKHKQHSNSPFEEGRKLSHSAIHEIAKYPIDTNVEVIHNCKQMKETNEDLDDDVFIEDETQDKTQQFDKSRLPDSKVLTECSDSIKKNSNENLNVELCQTETCVCSHCKTRVSRNMIEPVCDEICPKVLNDNCLIPKLCEKCNSLHGQNQNFYREVKTDKTDDLLIQNQCRFKEGNNRPSSTLSLESSGYAESSSCESTSSA